MSPLEMIKLGIQEGDINIVRQAYFNMTGEAIDTEEEEVVVEVATKKVVPRKKATKKKAAPKRKKATKKKAAPKRKKATKKKAAPRRKKAAVKAGDGFTIGSQESNEEVGNARWTGNLFQSEAGYSEPLSEEEEERLESLIGKGGQKANIPVDRYQPIDMVCEKCHKTVGVNPAHIVPSSKYFYCDPCLNKRR